MQRYEQFKVIREKKASEIIRLREDVKELNTLIARLRKILPKRKLKEVSPKLTPIKKAKAVKKSAKAKPKGELRQFEAELADIEGKLGKLR